MDRDLSTRRIVLRAGIAPSGALPRGGYTDSIAAAGKDSFCSTPPPVVAWETLIDAS